MCTKAHTTKWAIKLFEMGFSKENVDAAMAQKCTTARGAVEWLCTQEAGSTVSRSSSSNASNNTLASRQALSPAKWQKIRDPGTPVSRSSGTDELLPDVAEHVQQDKSMQWSELRPSSVKMSHRLSLGSLLRDPSDTWTPAQCQAALVQLRAIGSKLRASGGQLVIRRRLSGKQSTAPIAYVPKRRRLLWKQPDVVAAYYIGQTPGEFANISENGSLSATDAASSSVNVKSGDGTQVASSARLKMKASHVKWTALLLDMGFPQDRIDASLRQCKTLRKAIDCLCSSPARNGGA